MMEAALGRSKELAIAGRDAGPWEALDLVGEGASSFVWRAKHRVTGRIAALKIAKEAAASALAREAALLARVARRWGSEIIDAAPGYLATAWVEGKPVDPCSVRGDRERFGCGEPCGESGAGDCGAGRDFCDARDHGAFAGGAYAGAAPELDSG